MIQIRGGDHKRGSLTASFYATDQNRSFLAEMEEQSHLSQAFQTKLPPACTWRRARAAPPGSQPAGPLHPSPLTVIQRHLWIEFRTTVNIFAFYIWRYLFFTSSFFICDDVKKSGVSRVIFQIHVFFLTVHSLPRKLHNRNISPIRSSYFI